MKFAILLFAVLCGSSCVNAQVEASTYDTLLHQLSSNFLTVGKDPSKTYFEHLQKSLLLTMRLENNLLTSYIERIQSKDSTIKTASAVSDLVDSLLKNVIQNDLWKGREQILETNERVLEFYNSKFCPCLSSQIKSEKDFINLLTITQSCEQSLKRDILFTTRMSGYTQSLTMESKLALAQHASRYSFQNCDALQLVMRDALVREAVANYQNEIAFLVERLDEKIISLWQKSAHDSLYLLFPSYKKHERTLSDVSKILKNSKSSLYDLKEKGDSVFVTRTLASDFKNPRILGQSIYLYVLRGASVRFLSIQFKSPSEILNRKELLRELSEVPPPMERIKE